MSARFYYYPQPAGNHKVIIDLEENLSELFSDWDVDASDGRGMDGSIFRSVGRNGEVINIQRDRMKGGESLAVKFLALQNHLDRGFSVSFTTDHTKAWAAPVLNTPNGGDFTFFVGANPFSVVTHYTGTNVEPANGQYLVIENQPPGMIQEVLKIDVQNVDFNTGGYITASDRINFSYPSTPFVRWYRYWPILKRPQEDIGKNIISNEHGLNFSLSLRLVPDYSTLFAFHPGERRVFDPGLIQDSPVTGPLPDTAGRFSLDSYADPRVNQAAEIASEKMDRFWSRFR
tara:strand:+ start:7049 stop:7909 length:861 start_codon:yes stop_codon:yes gene_type:complete